MTRSNVKLGGQEFILDADADTSITADTDDQIDFKVGGTDRLSIGSTSTFVDDVSIAGSSPTFQMADTDVSNNVMNFSYDEQFTIAIDPNNARGSSALILTQDNHEVLRTDGSRNIMLANNAYNSNQTGMIISSNGVSYVTADNTTPLYLNRLTSDGNILELQQAGSQEGAISVSGTTVTYGGFSGQHESSGIPTNTPIGTVVSTIDELDVYASKQGEAGKETDSPKAGQTRADHAKVEVSDTTGDSAVYGVVSSFNAQGKVNVASVGIGSVRVTGACAKGDLLESNGDGTAKVQSDDIVRSKTIGKVTIGNSNTGVKLVSCVLYCG